MGIVIPDAGSLVDAVEGTQIAKSVSVSGAGTSIIHTVTTGKTFYLDAAWLNADSTAASTTGVNLIVRDTGDVTQYTMSFNMHANGNQSNAISFPVPISIPEGWDIVLNTSLAGLSASAFIHGYER